MKSSAVLNIRQGRTAGSTSHFGSSKADAKREAEAALRESSWSPVRITIAKVLHDMLKTADLIAKVLQRRYRRHYSR
jgi:hypothetical protein